MTAPLLMGILNTTPDSFSDQGAWFSYEKALQRGLEMVKEGADILDIGGASSRPNASPVSTEEELRRTIPLIEELSPQISVPISIDTVNPVVAEMALKKGARLINDVSGFVDPEMRTLAAGCTANLCLMHRQGTPETMQINPTYPDGVIVEILRFFEKQIALLVREGVAESRIILDPGIGFGKTLEHNLTILKGIDQFKVFGLRILIGASRKAFLTKILSKPPEELLAATLAVHVAAALRGADIIRAHDIKEHRDALNVTARLL